MYLIVHCICSFDCLCGDVGTGRGGGGEERCNSNVSLQLIKVRKNRKDNQETLTTLGTQDTQKDPEKLKG